MIRKLVNKCVALYLKTQYSALQKAINNPEDTQRRVLRFLLSKGQKTSFGKAFSMSSQWDYDQFRENVPISNYEGIQPEIEKMMLGERDVLWPGKVKWFAKSSGTTSSRSKFIPVTNVNLYQNHIKASWDSVSILYHKQDVKMFENQCLIMCGSLEPYAKNPDARIGDVSAILIGNMQAIARPFYTPDFETALLPDWEEKIEKIAQQASVQNVSMVGGVPTWNIVLFNRILEITGKSNMLEVWPNFKVYMHGGVGFEPYRAIFKEYFPSEKVMYREVYNASEGYFAVQDDPSLKAMMLLLKNGIFYEFIPMSEINKEKPKAIPIWDVEEGVNYAMVISTNAGLWRYVIGDTIQFASTRPYRIRITGRISSYINVFGEEVVISNTDQALTTACKKHDVEVFDYTVAPVFIDQGNKGAHEWLIEFEKAPKNVQAFAKDLDDALKAVNSDYEAKRYKDMALRSLNIHSLPKNTFKNWLKSEGRVGAQAKIPRLSNDRKHVDSILEFIGRNKIHVDSM